MPNTQFFWVPGIRISKHLWPLLVCCCNTMVMHWYTTQNDILGNFYCKMAQAPVYSWYWGILKYIGYPNNVCHYDYKSWMQIKLWRNRAGRVPTHMPPCHHTLFATFHSFYFDTENLPKTSWFFSWGPYGLGRSFVDNYWGFIYSINQYIIVYQYLVRQINRYSELPDVVFMSTGHGPGDKSNSGISNSIEA